MTRPAEFIPLFMTQPPEPQATLVVPHREGVYWWQHFHVSIWGGPLAGHDISRPVERDGELVHELIVRPKACWVREIRTDLDADPVYAILKDGRAVIVDEAEGLAWLGFHDGEAERRKAKRVAHAEDVRAWRARHEARKAAGLVRRF